MGSTLLNGDRTQARQTCMYAFESFSFRRIKISYLDAVFILEHLSEVKSSCCKLQLEWRCEEVSELFFGLLLLYKPFESRC